MANIPRLEIVNAQGDFDRIATDVAQRLENSRPFEYEVMEDELKKLGVQLSEDPSLETLSYELKKIQDAKDRVGEIYKLALKNHLLYDKVTEVLLAGWKTFSEKKSTDQREGEAMLKLSQFLLAQVEAESFYKTVTQTMGNLDKQHETVSRQISCFQLQLKLRDYKGFAGNTLKAMTSKAIDNGTMDDGLTGWDKGE